MAVMATPDLVRCEVDQARLVATWRLPRKEVAPSNARMLVRGALGALGLERERIEDGEVMACELTTNAITHAVEPYELRLWLGETVVCWEVADGTARLASFPTQAARAAQAARPDGACAGADLDAVVEALDEGGRGLAIVARLSDGRCGSRRLPAEGEAVAMGVAVVKGVWFALSRPAAFRRPV